MYALDSAGPALQRSRGAGRLSVKRSGEASRLDRLYQQGCAKILVPETNGPVEAVMVNTSGGMTGGDRLEWGFEAGEGTELTVTSQACERVYASSGGNADAEVHLKLAETSKLAWLPQETILFDKGALTRTIDVGMAEDAELLMAEAVIFGRQAMGETVREGSLYDRWRVRRNGRLVHAEDFRLTGYLDQALVQGATMAGKAATATLLLVSPKGESLVAEVRKIIGGDGGASFWNGKLLARSIATDSYTLRKTLVPLLKLLNPSASLPKVWSL